MIGVQIFLSLSDDDRIVEFASSSNSAQFDFKIVVRFTFAIPFVIVECPKKKPLDIFGSFNNVKENDTR